MQNGKNIFDTPIFPTWCPGCGNFGLWGSLKQALVNLKISPDNLLTFFGIGCSGNMSSFLGGYGLHSLHGRSIPGAAGAKLANPQLSVVVVAGDGDLLGEGLNHFIAGARANYDITVIVHNNQVYGLTTGQASPTTSLGMKLKTTPDGVIDFPIDPCQLAIAEEAAFVSRGFAGDIGHLTEIITRAITTKGFSVVDVLQPCVTWNKVNNYQWFRDRVKKLEQPVVDKYEAMREVEWTDKKISTGIIFTSQRPAYHQIVWPEKKENLVSNSGKARNVDRLMDKFL